MWPFDIFAKRREREYQKQREEHDKAMQRLKESIDAAERRRKQFQATVTGSDTSRTAAAAAQRHATLRAVPSITQSSTYGDSLGPINPLSPIHQISQFSTWSVPDEPRHSSSSHCDTLSSHASHSSSDYSSSHSSHDHSCSSSSYDSGSSSNSSDY